MTSRILVAVLTFAGLLEPMRAQPPACAHDAAAALRDGVAAFKNAQYAEAVEHFRQAVESDPDCVTARVYLGTAYLQQYVPGVESPDNVAMAAAAQREFELVLKTDANNRIALESIATLCFHEKKLDEAAAWYQKIVAMDGNAKEAFYTLGVLGWTRIFETIRLAREKAGMALADPGPLPDAAIREKLRRSFLPVIEEAMSDLRRALEIDPKYSDAMAYLNLLYRSKADLEDSVQAYRDDIAIADGWFQKVVEARKAEADH